MGNIQEQTFSPLMRNLMPEADWGLVSASLSASSWRSFNSALNCLENFSKWSGCMITWPLCDEITVNFVKFCLNVKKISPATVKNYISNISLAHTLKNLNASSCHNKVAKLMIRCRESRTLQCSLLKSPSCNDFATSENLRP